jgi:hypothetical protein
MKKITIIFVVLALVVTACKKDKEDKGDILQTGYFSIENATLVKENFPAASGSNAPQIGSVYGNSSVLAGGSNPLTITTDAAVKEILVGVEGQKGYYKINPGTKKAATQTYLVYLLFSQKFVSSNFNIIVAIVNNSGQISQSEIIAVSQVEAGTGKLQVSCSWDKSNDLDLHLIEPNGFDINWDEDKSPNGGFLDVDSNPICFIDNINNENVTYSGTAKIENGKYKVKISLFSGCQVTDITNYVVTVRYNGTLIAPVTGKNPYYGKVAASHAYIGGDGPRGGEVIMEFNIASNKSGNIESQELLQFSYPKKVNVAKRAMLSK